VRPKVLLVEDELECSLTLAVAFHRRSGGPNHCAWQRARLAHRGSGKVRPSYPARLAAAQRAAGNRGLHYRRWQRRHVARLCVPPRERRARTAALSRGRGSRGAASLTPSHLQRAYLLTPKNPHS